MKHSARITVTGVLHDRRNPEGSPEVRIMEGSGLEICNFVIQQDQYDKDGNPKEYQGVLSKPLWHFCSAFGQEAVRVSQMRCGSTVTVGGEPQRRKDDKGEWREEIKVKWAQVEEAYAPPAKVEFPDVCEIINLDDDEDYI